MVLRSSKRSTRLSQPPATFSIASLRVILPKLYQHLSRGIFLSRSVAGSSSFVFQLKDLRMWLQAHATGTSACQSGKSATRIPSMSKLLVLLRKAQRAPGAQLRGSFRYALSDGTCEASNLKGFTLRETKASQTLHWSIFANTIKLREVGCTSKCSLATFELVYSSSVSTIGCERIPNALRLVVGGPRRKTADSVKRKQLHCPAITLRQESVETTWTLIYLHDFQGRIETFADKPHFYLDGSVPVKVVLPQAPTRECKWLPPWNEWRAGAWRRKRLRSWYDYLTDRQGRREDDVGMQSVDEIRQLLHNIISREAQNLGGRADRIIIGGKSQGCCTALDAALTYPRQLGGVIGVVGHLLQCTPLDVKKAKMLIRLMNVKEDRVVRWDWVEPKVQRMKEAGFNVHSQLQSNTEGHFVQSSEGAWIRSSLRQIVGVGTRT